MRNIQAAIDFGTSKVVTLVAESKGANRRCNMLGVGSVPYDGYSKGYWNVPVKVDDAIEASLQEASNSSKHTIRNISVGVPGEFCRVYTTEVTLNLQKMSRAVTPDDVNRLFANADEEIGDVPGRIIHRSPAWFMLDGGAKTMEPVGNRASTIKALMSFVYADEFFIDDVLGRLKKFNVEVDYFLSTPVGEAIYFLSVLERDQISVLLDIGYLNTEIMVVEGETMIFHKTIPIGGAHITLDLRYALDVPMATAEQIKRSFVFGMPGVEEIKVTGEMGKEVSFPYEEVANVLKPRVDEIAEIIGQELNESGVRLASWNKMYLTGGGLAMMEGGASYLSSQMGRPVREVSKNGSKLSSLLYGSSLGLIDLVFDTIESQDEGSLLAKIQGGVSRLWKR